MRRWVSYFQFPLFIDVEVKTALNSKLNHIWRVDFVSQIVWHIRLAKYDPFMLHDLIHHKIKILVINLPTVFTSFKRRLRM